EKIYTVNNSKGEVLLDSDTNYSNSDYLIAEYTLSKPMELGKTYTITVKGNIENEDGGLAILCDEGRYFISKSVDKISGNIYRHTFTAIDSTWLTDNIRLYNYPNSSKESANIEWVRLEEGSVMKSQNQIKKLSTVKLNMSNSNLVTLIPKPVEFSPDNLYEMSTEVYMDMTNVNIDFSNDSFVGTISPYFSNTSNENIDIVITKYVYDKDSGLIETFPNNTFTLTSKGSNVKNIYDYPPLNNLEAKNSQITGVEQ